MLVFSPGQPLCRLELPTRNVRGPQTTTQETKAVRAVLGFDANTKSDSASGESQFWNALTAELLHGCGRFVAGNVDQWRFKRPFSPTRRAKDAVLSLAGALGFYRLP